MQLAWHVSGMTKLFGNCSSAPQLSGRSAPRYEFAEEEIYFALGWIKLL